MAFEDSTGRTFRYRRRVACTGLIQLRASRRVLARRKLVAIALAVPLSLRELADVFGVEYMTVVNHMTPGKTMARARERWYHRLQSVEVSGDVVTITLQYLPTRKRTDFLLRRKLQKARAPH